MYCVCCRDLDPIQGQDQGHGPFKLPTIAHNCTFLGLSPPPFSRGAQNWWLTLIVWDLVDSLSEPDFRISFYERYHYSSYFTECRYFTTFKWPHISVLREDTVTWLGTLVVLHVLCVGVTLTRSKVKVNITGLLNFRQLAKPCMLAAMTAAPLRGFLVYVCLVCVCVCTLYDIHNK